MVCGLAPRLWQQCVVNMSHEGMRTQGSNNAWRIGLIQINKHRRCTLTSNERGEGALVGCKAPIMCRDVTLLAAAVTDR